MEEMMNKELMEALDVLEKEKEISKETLFEAIENSLMTACKNHFGKAERPAIFWYMLRRKSFPRRMMWRMTACRLLWRMHRRFPREHRWAT